MRHFPFLFSIFFFACSQNPTQGQYNINVPIDDSVDIREATSDYKFFSDAPDSQNLEVRITLKPKDFAKLEAMVDASADPDNSKYMKFSTFAEVKADLIPDEATLNEIEDLLSKTFQAGEYKRHGLQYILTASVATQEKFFNTNFALYANTQNTITRTYPNSYPTMPVELQHYFYSSFAFAKLPPASPPALDALVLDDVASASDFMTRYNTASWQSVTLPANLEAHYNIKPLTATNTIYQGAIGFIGEIYSSEALSLFSDILGGGELAKNLMLIGSTVAGESVSEADLDVQILTGVNPSAQTVYLSMPTINNVELDFMDVFNELFVVNNPIKADGRSPIFDNTNGLLTKSKIYSISYGQPEEFQFPTRDDYLATKTILTALNAMGYTFIAASGDGGSTTNVINNSISDIPYYLGQLSEPGMTALEAFSQGYGSITALVVSKGLDGNATISDICIYPQGFESKAFGTVFCQRASVSCLEKLLAPSMATKYGYYFNDTEGLFLSDKAISSDAPIVIDGCNFITFDPTLMPNVLVSILKSPKYSPLQKAMFQSFVNTTQANAPAMLPNVTTVSATIVANKVSESGCTGICEDDACNDAAPGDISKNAASCNPKTADTVEVTSWPLNSTYPTLLSGGGGFSRIATAPAWQSSAIAGYFSSWDSKKLNKDGSFVGQDDSTIKAFNAKGRGYPDISMNGNNYITVNPATNGGGTTVNPRGAGTSASAPAFAALLARLAAELGVSGFGNINHTLYKMGEAGVMNDIDDDSMNNCRRPPANLGCYEYSFKTAKGWDPVTGLGTPDYTKMLNWFKGQANFSAGN